MSETKLIRIQEQDNVAIAIAGLKKGEEAECQGQRYVAAEEIPVSHKIALQDLEAGSTIVKYGCPIGVATRRIARGEWVHSHNMKTGLEGKLEYEYHPTGGVRKFGRTEETFLGYRRANGDVGTRNEIWVVPTVACVNHTARMLAELASEKYGHLCDGIYAYPHNAGCSQLGVDHETTQKILASMIRHPNAGGVLVVSLGCENNNLGEFRPVLGEVDESRIRFLICQEEENELEKGLALLGEIAEEVSGDRRVETPVSKLKIGFKCGGSDALSGVTANPLCGQVANRIVERGGIGILTEVPEMFGAETILMNRADSEETFQKVVALINSFKQYYIDYGQPIYENPAPGNKAGGITTLEEKSLGCIQKGGQAAVTDTLMYGERAVRPGLNLMNGPGNDSVSVTNLVAGGAQVLLFTTGRGNPLGTSIPCLKIASNTVLYEKKRHWFDFNAGSLVDGDTLEELGEKLWQTVIKVASGKMRTQNEKNGYKDIMIFKNGVLL